MRTICLLTLAGVLSLATPAAAEGPGKIETMVLAGSDDQTIRRVLTEALPLAAVQLEQFGSDAALVYSQRVYSTSSASYRFVDNLVWWVKEGQAEDLTTYLDDYARSWDITEVRAFVIRPGEYSMKAALNAPIERLTDDRIHLQESSRRDKRTSLVVAFETAGPGDILAVSVAAKVRHRLRWEPWFLADALPVGRAELRVICDMHQAYSVFGMGFAPGQVQQEILFQDRGQIRDLVMRADAVPPYVDEPYSLPWRDQSPCLRVVWRGTSWTWDGKHRIWTRYDEWNQIAVDMADMERQFLSRTKRVDQLAREMAAGLTRDAAADSLYRFVRDDLQTVSASLFGRVKDEPTVEDILKVRAGEDWEKAYLLLAMLRALDFPAEIVWAHDPDDGHLFSKYPSWGQMDVPFVRANVADSERWYDLNCAACSPGTIQPLMRGAEAMTYVADADLQNKKIVDRLVADALGRDVDFFSLYLRQIGGRKWQTSTRLPGQKGAAAGAYVERVQLCPDRTAPLAGLADLRATDFMPMGTRLNLADDPQQAARTWFRERFPAARKDSVLALHAATDDTLRASLRFTVDALPEPMGDTWILPATTLMGSRCIDSWPEQRSAPFNIAEEREHVWEMSVPLPADWEDVQLPPSRSFGFRWLQYEAGFRVREGRLHMIRHLVEKPVRVVNQPDLDVVSDEIRKIIAFESTPVVVQRKGNGP